MDDVRVSAAAKVLQAIEAANHGGEYPLSEFLEDAEAVLKAADAVDPLRNQRMVATDEEFAALPADTRIWGSSHRQPGVAGSGSPYVKLEDGMWWDFGNEYAVGSDDIMRPAVVVYWPTEAP